MIYKDGWTANDKLRCWVNDLRWSQPQTDDLGITSFEVNSLEWRSGYEKKSIRFVSGQKITYWAKLINLIPHSPLLDPKVKKKEIQGVWYSLFEKINGECFLIEKQHALLDPCEVIVFRDPHYYCTKEANFFHEIPFENWISGRVYCCQYILQLKNGPPFFWNIEIQ